ncbi:MAG: hypothetical protein JNN04_13215 [Cyclobacteriaceae bacterium]|nr:hypothetical protein [Cyclobacteriaceae bacterium]
MSRYPLLCMVLLLWISCTPKKTETTAPPADSTAIDSVLATTPAPALLAFAPVDGYTAAKGLETPDSVTYSLLNSPEDLQRQFAAAGTASAPDFIINYVIGVACQSTTRSTTITMDKVITGENTLDVYLNISRGAEGKQRMKPVQIFAIEKREGYPVMQFYVNGKKDKALVLVGNP